MCRGWCLFVNNTILFECFFGTEDIFLCAAVGTDGILDRMPTLETASLITVYSDEEFSLISFKFEDIVLELVSVLHVENVVDDAADDGGQGNDGDHDDDGGQGEHGGPPLAQALYI